MDRPAVITDELIAYIRQTYRLNWNGIHGFQHWTRVCENGLRLARQNGANQVVVALFAFTHDMDRYSDGRDYQHGPRAALRIQSELQGTYIHLTPGELALLVQAVSQHTHGLVDADITVQTCWDADRLDIGRVGIIPNVDLLCTREAKDPVTIRWAYERSIGARSE